MDLTRRLSSGTWAPALVGLVGIVSLVLVFGFTSDITIEQYVNEPIPANLIAYWHIGLAWSAGVAMFVTFLSSIQYLRTRQRFWNLLAGSSGEIGFLMLTGALIMGSIWGSVIWQTYWYWGDVRLVTMFITWFVYAGYLLVFNSTKDGEGRFAATYGTVGFVTIPLTYLSTRIWQTAFHNPTIGGGGGEGFPFNPVTFAVAIVAIMLLYAYVTSLRTRTLMLRDRVIQEVRTQ